MIEMIQNWAKRTFYGASLKSTKVMRAKFTEVVGGTVGGTPVIPHGVNELSR